MLLAATIFALVLGTAVSAPYGNQRHYGHGRGASSLHENMNHLLQTQNMLGPLKQGFLCDWCVVSVEDAQSMLRQNLNQIYGILNRTSALCELCPVPQQCNRFFENDVPAAIEEALAQSPETICNDAGLCDMNATIPGMVMNNLNSGVARDRVIKDLLNRARKLQQEMIRMIYGTDYLCDTCQEFISTTRDILLSNETQQEVMNFLTPLCDYMPTEIQADCDEFVQSLPSLMTMVARDILLDSTCTELGFCNTKAEKPLIPDIIGGQHDVNGGMGTPDTVGTDIEEVLTDIAAKLPDVMSRFGFNLEIPEIPKGWGKTPFQFPSQGGQGWNLFGGTGTSQQSRPYGRPSQGQGGQGGQGWNPLGGAGTSQQSRPYGRPSQPGRGYGTPQQHPSPNQNPRPSRPKPKPEAPKTNPIPDFNLEDMLPEIPEIPKIRVNLPQWGWRRQRRAVKDKIPDILPELLPKLSPKDKVNLEYVPDPIPDAGITITGNGQGASATEDCEICKMAVTAVDTWLQDNAAQLQQMVSQFALPFCTVFPSPMKEDCVTDVSEFVQTFIQILVSKLQPEPICTWLGQCDATVDVPAVPNVPYAPTGEAPRVEPTTWPLMP